LKTFALVGLLYTTKKKLVLPYEFIGVMYLSIKTEKENQIHVLFGNRLVIGFL